MAARTSPSRRCSRWTTCTSRTGRSGATSSCWFARSSRSPARGAPTRTTRPRVVARLQPPPNAGVAAGSGRKSGSRMAIAPERTRAERRPADARHPGFSRAGTRADSTPPFPAVSLFDVPLVAVTYDRIVVAVNEALAGQPATGLTVDAVNTMGMAESCVNDRMHDALRAYDAVVPDGMPLVWCMNAKGAGLEDRVYGPYLTDRVLATLGPRTPRRRAVPGGPRAGVAGAPHARRGDRRLRRRARLAAPGRAEALSERGLRDALRRPERADRRTVRGGLP